MTPRECLTGCSIILVISSVSWMIIGGGNRPVDSMPWAAVITPPITCMVWALLSFSEVSSNSTVESVSMSMEQVREVGRSTAITCGVTSSPVILVRVSASKFLAMMSALRPHQVANEV